MRNFCPSLKIKLIINQLNKQKLLVWLYFTLLFNLGLYLNQLKI